MFSLLKNIFLSQQKIAEKVIVKLLVLVLVSFIALFLQNILIDDYEINLQAFGVTLLALALGAHLSEKIAERLSTQVTPTKRES